jgi:hypothetical protein
MGWKGAIGKTTMGVRLQRGIDADAAERAARERVRPSPQLPAATPFSPRE